MIQSASIKPLDRALGLRHFVFSVFAPFVGARQCAVKREKMMKTGVAGKGVSTGFVTVRLRVAVDAKSQTKTLSDMAKRNALPGLAKILERIGNPKTERLITVVPPEKLLEMERAAASTDFPPLRSLTQYWRIDLRDRDRVEVKELIALLSRAREVELVHEELEPTPPVVTPGDDPYNVSQGYQNAAPTGIDARWMWTQADGEGAGVAVVDIEGAWNVTHQDLVSKSPTLIHGAQGTAAGWFDHGTSVLGEIVATDNTVGVVGTAPAVTSVRMSSIFDAAQTFHVEDAFIAAIAAMTAGDILLIELQTGFLPQETIDAQLDLIRLATSQGILVVEAGGNGASDLDAWTDGSAHHRLNRGSPDFVDSGALLVGACVSAVPHERWQFSNFGSRVDCFAWGEHVTSCGYGDLDNGGGDPNKKYTAVFQGTSSASPIIVGAAALVQSRHKAVSGSSLSPAQLRSLLSNPATGTAQGVVIAGHIGVMPNLAAIVPNLGLTPDVYVRDEVGDTGAIPWPGAISSSPDVIVQPGPVAGQATFGEGSGTENSNSLGSKVEFGQDNFVYVRVRNRGGSPASNVTATVYWSPPATLVTPNLWNLVGSTVIANVPVGDVLTVAPAIQWPSAQVPPTGHYCFVAVLDHPSDPAPPTPTTMSWNDYLDLVRANNNITWRNFNVVNEIPPSGTPSGFPFMISGPWGRPEPFEFEIERRLPRDAVLAIEGPFQLIAALGKGRPGKVEVLKERRARLLLPSLPRIRLGGIALGEAVKHACQFVIRPGREPVAWGHGVAIRQLHRGQEVGRVAWRFAPAERLAFEKPVKPRPK